MLALALSKWCRQSCMKWYFLLNVILDFGVNPWDERLPFFLSYLSSSTFWMLHVLLKNTSDSIHWWEMHLKGDGMHTHNNLLPDSRPPRKKKEVRDMRKLVFSFTSGSMLYCVTQIACSGHMKLLLIRSKMSSDPKRNLPAATDWGLSTEFHFHLIPLDYFSREKKKR